MACEADKAIEKLKEAALDVSKPRTQKAASTVLEDLGLEADKPLGSRSMDNLIRAKSAEVLRELRRATIGKTFVVSNGVKFNGIRVSSISILEKNKVVNINGVKYTNNGKGRWFDTNGNEINDFDVVYSDVIREATMGSEARSEFNYDPENEVPHVMDSVDNIVEMGELIEQVSGIKDSKEHSDYLRGLSKMLDVDFLHKMKVYLNDKAGDTFGQIISDKISLHISKADKVLNTDMSGKEVYWHEIMHAFTRFAIDSKDPKAYKFVKKLDYLRREAAKVITPEMLMPKESLDYDAEMKVAQERWEYIFNSPERLHEFLAYGLTNERMISELKKLKVKELKEEFTLFDRIANIATTLFNFILGNFDYKSVGDTKYNALLQLTADLMQHNARSERTLQNSEDIVPKIVEWIDRANKPLIAIREKLVEFAEKGDITPPPENPSKWELAKWIAKFLPKLLLRDDMKPYREWVFNAFRLRPEDWLNNVIRDFSIPDVLERTIERAALASDSIDTARNTLVQAMALGVKKELGKISEVEEEAITAVGIDLDLESIYSDYSKEELVAVLNDPSKEIARLKGEIKKLDGDNFYWYTNQARGLGRYLVSGIPGLAQNPNASNIARGILTGQRITPVDGIVELIDKLATLEAIDSTPKYTRDMFIGVMEKSPKGVDFAINVHRGIKEESKEKLFTNDVQMLKGYSREIFADNVDVVIRPLRDRKKMEHEGYRFEEEVSPDVDDSSAIRMAIYKSTMYMGNSYNRQATRMTDMKKRGTSLIDKAFFEDNDKIKAAASITRADVAKYHRRRLKIVEEMKKGVYNDDSKISPIVSETGKVVMYRYNMSKADKKRYLEQDTRVSEVLAKTKGSIFDKVESSKHNDAILSIILDDMEENYEEGMSTGKNKKLYIKIEQFSPDPKIQEIYKILPQNIKEAIRKQPNGYIAVRRDMLLNYFGSRDASLVDILESNWVTDRITPAMVKKLIKLAETIWREVVKISKVDIVIRTPMVFVNNVISNYLYTKVHHLDVGLIEIMKMSLDNLNFITDYLQKSKEIAELRVQKTAGLNVDRAIVALENELKKSPIHELMEAGMYQAIIEDVERSDFKSNNKISQYIDKKSTRVPDLVKQGIHHLYITDRSPVFRFMQKATQYSDFVARATEYQLLMKKIDKRGMTPKELERKKMEAREVILDAFINYNKPASRWEEYLNDMGLIMFTKYMKRIQRVIARDSKEKPMQVLLAMLGQEFLFGDVPEIYENNLVTRDYPTIGISPSEHIWRATIPAYIRAMW